MKSIKPGLLKWHRRVGMALGLFLIVQGLTGASLVFRDEIERVIHPAMTVAPAPARVSLQRMIDVVAAAHPDFAINRAEFPGVDSGAVLFKLVADDGTRRLVGVDPFRGVVVRDGTLWAWPGEVIFLVHESLMAGPVGETLIGVLGLGLLFMAVTGPIVWWPGRNRIRQGLKVILDKGADRRWRTLHRAGGAVVAALLVMSATTGVLMVWKPELRALFGIADRPAPKVAEQPERAFVPVDRLVTRARADYGALPLRQLRFPSGGRVVAVFLDSDLGIRADATKQVYFDRYTGRELARYIGGALPAGGEGVEGLFTVHSGLYGGVATRLLLVLTGLSLATMAASGLWLRYSRTAKRRSRPVPARAAAAERA